jgi:hypothetical protein
MVTGVFDITQLDPLLAQFQLYAGAGYNVVYSGFSHSPDPVLGLPDSAFGSSPSFSSSPLDPGYNFSQDGAVVLPEINVEAPSAASSAFGQYNFSPGFTPGVSEGIPDGTSIFDQYPPDLGGDGDPWGEDNEE